MTVGSWDHARTRGWCSPATAAHAFIAAAALLLASCTVQLVPAYDDYIANNLTQLSQTIETYYAAMPAPGYSKESFPKQEAFYADTLGKIEALKTRAASRPVPDAAVTRWLGMQQKPENGTVVGNGIPTVASLGKVSELVMDLRDRQRANGLSAAFVKNEVGQIRIALNGAITYEMALKR